MKIITTRTRNSGEDPAGRTAVFDREWTGDQVDLRERFDPELAAGGTCGRAAGGFIDVNAIESKAVLPRACAIDRHRCGGPGEHRAAHIGRNGGGRVLGYEVKHVAALKRQRIQLLLLDSTAPVSGRR